VVELVYSDAIEGTLRSFHANDGETSVYLTHSPDLVQERLAVDEPVDYQRPVFSYHSRKLTRSGVIGCPTRASADRGRTIVDFAVADLVALIERGLAEAEPYDVWDAGVPET